ncbi:MAG: dephospho-CoA kinase [Thermoleophilia bacterium]
MTTATQSNKPFRLALTGGIGSGKSTALTMFGVHGAAVLDSDQVVHRLLQRCDVRERVAAGLGIETVAAGEAGRRRLADVVFSDPAQLDRLQQVIFPLVRAELEAWLATPGTQGAPLAVVELPMLFEAQLTDLFDQVVLITAAAAIREARHAVRVTRADFERRSARQLPEAEKRVLADIVFDNDGSPEELDLFVAGLVQRLTA